MSDLSGPPNHALSEQVLKYIRTHRKEWDQSMWARRSACGTTMCYAGFVVQFSNFKLVWNVDHLVGRETCFAVRVDGTTQPIEEVAMRLLGLEDGGIFHDQTDDYRKFAQHVRKVFREAQKDWDDVHAAYAGA